MHAADPEKSTRLKKLLSLLTEHRKPGITTAQIQRHTGSVAPATDVSELRQRGFAIRCKYDGKTRTNRRIYRYFLERNATR